MKNFFLISRRAVFLAVGLCLALPALAWPLQPVTAIDSSATPASGGGGDSWHPIITPDGRYVLFASWACNLAVTASNTAFTPMFPPRLNAFLRDRTNGTTTLVSVNWSGTGSGNGDSVPTALSTNGQFALFESAASDLMPGDTNNATDIFLRDMVNGTNLLVSVSTNGGCASGPSHTSAMTPDGRYVAFSSAARNLVPGETNGIAEIYVRDMQTGMTTLASPGFYINPWEGSSDSDSPEITPDGRYVAFLGTVTNRSGGQSAPEVHVRDMVAGTTFVASTNAHQVLAGTLSAYSHAISDDGQFVAFVANTISSPLSAGVVFRYNLPTGGTDVVGSNAIATLSGFKYFRTLDMTPDGRFIAFVGHSNDPNTSCVLVWDAQTATTTVASVDMSGNIPTNSVCDWPALDASGRYVAFLSTATNLTTNVVSGDFHLYVRDLQAGATTLVDVGPGGAGLAKDFLSAPCLTPDGRFVAFDCTDADLVTNDNNQAYDVFVRDLTAGTNDLISVRQPALPSQTPGGTTLGPVYSVNTDGRYVAFLGTGNSLLAGGYTNAYRGVFVRDQLNGTNILASADTNGLGGADGWSFDLSISGDGRYVAFTSGADNLVAGDTNVAQDVFLRDLQTGSTALVSVNTNLTGSGNGASYSPATSADGRYVLFLSKASNLAPGTPVSAQNLFYRDLQAAVTYALTHGSAIGVTNAVMTPDGHFVAFVGQLTAGSLLLYVWDTQEANYIYTNSNTGITGLGISPDGSRVAYSFASSSQLWAADLAAHTNRQIGTLTSTKRAGLKFSGDGRFLVYATAAAQVSNDTNGVADIYLYDWQTKSNFLVSQSYNRPAAANGASDSPVISADGRFVAYRSAASNVVPGDTNGVPDIFLYDRSNAVTTLLSVSAFGDVAGNNRSLFPTFSGDGQTLVFQSWASDLVAQDFNQGADLFALKLASTNPVSVFAGQMVYAPTSGQAPTLTWPATDGKTYAVQYKDALSDPVWQPLIGSVTVVGDRAYATDLAPHPGHRFYRIVAY